MDYTTRRISRLAERVAALEAKPSLIVRLQVNDTKALDMILAAIAAQATVEIIENEPAKVLPDCA